MHAEYLLNADLDFSPVTSANWCITGSRLIELELSSKKADPCLKRKAARNGLYRWWLLYITPPKSHGLVLLSKKHTHTTNLWTKPNSLFAPNSPQ